MDPYIGEIRIFAGNFAPRGWAMCNGQLIPISQNTALFSLLGTMYGGDGKSTYALPNLQDRVPVRFGQGPGLSSYFQGGPGGSATTTVLHSQMPNHTHGAMGTTDPANQAGSADGYLAAAPGSRGQRGPSMYDSSNAAPVSLSPAAVGIAGSSQPISLVKPVVALNFIIALQGIFPPRE